VGVEVAIGGKHELNNIKESQMNPEQAKPTQNG